MKSSTIRRSNLSKEKMAVLEALAKYKHDSYDNSVGVYVDRTGKKNWICCGKTSRLTKKLKNRTMFI